jgi:hypothetical protein
MKFLQYSRKEMILLNVLFSAFIAVLLTFGFIQPAWDSQTLLNQKLAQMQDQAQTWEIKSNETVINFTELLKIMKINSLSEIQVVSTAEDDGVLHLKFIGTVAALHSLMMTLAPSNLVSAKLQQLPVNVELSLDLKDLRVVTAPPVVDVPAPVAAPVDQLVGQATYNHHHYCVVKTPDHKVRLLEKSPC